MHRRRFSPSNPPHAINEPFACAPSNDDTEQVQSDTKTSDVALFSRAQGGDLSAFELLVERLRDDVYVLGLRMTRSERDAAEIAQESFLSAYMHLNKLRNEEELSAWVREAAASHAWSKARGLQKPTPDADLLNLPTYCSPNLPAHRRKADWSADANERALSPELRRDIEQATDRLPQRHRQIFVLKDIAELSYEQIAKITDDSISAVKSRLHQARLSMRESIDRFYREP